jgi:hypothetical protein
MQDIINYNNSLEKDSKAICDKLYLLFNKHLLNCSAKVWHRHPVWFDNGNPIVGYVLRKDSVSMLFWSGQSFDEVELKPSGNFKMSQIIYTDISEIDENIIIKWLQKSLVIQWDYKNVIKRKGELLPLKGL